MAVPFREWSTPPEGDARGWASLIEPDDIVAVDVVEAEILLRFQALHVVVPSVVDFLPDHWQQGRIVLHEFLGLADVGEPFRAIYLAVDFQKRLVEPRAVPEGVDLWAIGAVPDGDNRSPRPIAAACWKSGRRPNNIRCSSARASLIETAGSD